MNYRSADGFYVGDRVEVSVTKHKWIGYIDKIVGHNSHRVAVRSITSNATVWVLDTDCTRIEDDVTSN